MSIKLSSAVQRLFDIESLNCEGVLIDHRRHPKSFLGCAALSERPEEDGHWSNLQNSQISSQNVNHQRRVLQGTDTPVAGDT